MISATFNVQDRNLPAEFSHGGPPIFGAYFLPQFSITALCRPSGYVARLIYPPKLLGMAY